MHHTTTLPPQPPRALERKKIEVVIKCEGLKAGATEWYQNFELEQGQN